MSEKKLVTYPGAKSDVHWDGRLCIHIGECGRASNDLFVGGRQPWCQPDLREPRRGCRRGRSMSDRRADLRAQRRNRPRGRGRRERRLRDVQRSALRSWRLGGGRCRRRHDRSPVSGGALPLRTIEEQTVLRQQSRRGGLQRLLERLETAGKGSKRPAGPSRSATRRTARSCSAATSPSSRRAGAKRGPERKRPSAAVGIRRTNRFAMVRTRPPASRPTERRCRAEGGLGELFDDDGPAAPDLGFVRARAAFLPEQPCDHRG